jgi:Sec-independent protein translocase protein TatA
MFGLGFQELLLILIIVGIPVAPARRRAAARRDLTNCG